MLLITHSNRSWPPARSPGITWYIVPGNDPCEMYRSYKANRGSLGHCNGEPPYWRISVWNDYWIWVRMIWERPLAYPLRQIFADWLEDHHMGKAARKQRWYAEIIRDTEVMIRMNHSGQIWGRYRTRDGHRSFQMKRNGQLVMCKFSWPTIFDITTRQRNPHGFHILKVIPK